MAEPGYRRGWLGLPKGGVFWFGRLLLAGAVGVPIIHFASKPNYDEDAAHVSQLFSIGDTGEEFLLTGKSTDMSCTTTPKGEAAEIKCIKWPKPRSYDILYMLDPDTKAVEISGTFVDGRKTGNYIVRVINGSR